jgi:hypothetical protein
MERSHGLMSMDMEFRRSCMVIGRMSFVCELRHGMHRTALGIPRISRTNRSRMHSNEYILLIHSTAHIKLKIRNSL